MGPTFYPAQFMFLVTGPLLTMQNSCKQIFIEHLPAQSIVLSTGDVDIDKNVNKEEINPCPYRVCILVRMFLYFAFVNYEVV